MAKSSSIDKVRLEFQDFEMALRKRQAHMESMVEEAVSHYTLQELVLSFFQIKLTYSSLLKGLSWYLSLTTSCIIH